MRAGGMNISTHPGQYTVLASTRSEVVDAAVWELAYHDCLLTSFGLDSSHKIVLQVGLAARFTVWFERLTPGAAARLVLENDERWPPRTGPRARGARRCAGRLRRLPPRARAVVPGRGHARPCPPRGRDVDASRRPPRGPLLDAGTGEAPGRARRRARRGSVPAVRRRGRRPPARLRPRGEGQGTLRAALAGAPRRAAARAHTSARAAA